MLSFTKLWNIVLLPNFFGVCNLYCNNILLMPVATDNNQLIAYFT